MNVVIRNNLNKAGSIIPSLKRHMRCDQIEKQIVAALELLKATIELQEKRASGFYVLGSQHKHQALTFSPGSMATRDFYNQTLGQPYESTRQPEPAKSNAWPKDWPPYFHRNEPCDTLVGHCGCGAYHTEGEFTLEQDGLRAPYVARNIFNWPANHTGGGAYSSLCSCIVCGDLRASAQRRTDYQRGKRGN